jgi:hypothetical protein
MREILDNDVLLVTKKHEVLESHHVSLGNRWRFRAIVKRIRTPSGRTIAAMNRAQSSLNTCARFRAVVQGLNGRGACTLGLFPFKPMVQAPWAFGTFDKYVPDRR